MQTLSNAIVEIYEAAECLNIADFPGELLRLLQREIPFDGAVLGTGGRTTTEKTLVIDDAFIQNRDRVILVDYAKIVERDPVTAQFVSGLARPLVVDCGSFYRSPEHAQLHEFTRHHGIRQLMLYGNRVRAEGDTKWLVLYRNARSRFSERQSMLFGALWPHISRALSTNRIATIDAMQHGAEDKAVGLINPGGGIEFADATFRALLALEWNIFPVRTLPLAILHTAFALPQYVGRRIRLSTMCVHGYYVSRAERFSSIKELSRSEVVIATRFAQGHTYKEIGKQLGLSQNTIRVHLANCYRKLGVHNKIELGRLLLA
jgi:DNA-binding CsgD family transcriptional regulator